MDATPYPLVPFVPLQPPPVAVPIHVDPQSVPYDDDLLAILRRAFGRLAVLLFFALLLIRRLRRQHLELRAQVGFWRAMHQRAVLREGKLTQEIQRLQAEIRDWKKRSFGRKTETSNATQPENPNAPAPKKPKPRGQQANSKGHGRRNHEHLPAVDEVCDLPDEQKCCPDCQQPFEEIPGTADGTILEIEVKAYRRVYHRKRYRRR